mgnify:CR=1 FL=1
MKLFEMKHIKKSFDGLEVLKDISLDVEEGEVLSIIGPSGSGKSTFLRCLNRLEETTAGTVIVDDNDITDPKCNINKVRENIGMVFQQFNLLESKTVFQNVAIPLILEGIPKEKITERVKEVLHIVELHDKRDTYVTQLSGGQKQRVGIARALATEPAILLCDEATSALDPKTTESILGLLKRINKKMGVTILLITHQMQVIQMICNKVAVMGNGQIVEQGTVLDVFSQPHAPVTQEFVRTVINDQIPKSILDLLQTETRHYVIDRLKFIGASVKKPVISEICQIAGVEVNILGATVQEFGESIMCIFILQMFGSDDKLLQAEAQIDAAGVLRERVVFG